MYFFMAIIVYWRFPGVCKQTIGQGVLITLLGLRQSFSKFSKSKGISEFGVGGYIFMDIFEGESLFIGVFFADMVDYYKYHVMNRSTTKITKIVKIMITNIARENYPCKIFSWKSWFRKFHAKIMTRNILRENHSCENHDFENFMRKSYCIWKS